MKRVGLLSLVLILGATGAFAKLGVNGTSLNGVSLNGQNLNGTSLNGTSLNRLGVNGVSLNGESLNSESSGDGSSVIVQTITLADGTHLAVEPAH
jgi:uncharacterized protein YjbI with pentapeptide repeats